jgi:hypothetical protein
MTLEKILENVGAEVADVRVTVNGRSAGVHLYHATSWIERVKLFDRARVGVEDADGHDG